jgi:hypothetical protein
MLATEEIENVSVNDMYGWQVYRWQQKECACIGTTLRAETQVALSWTAHYSGVGVVGTNLIEAPNIPALPRRSSQMSRP